MMSDAHHPKSIVVIDVGATNAKVLQFDSKLEVVAERSVPAVRTDGLPYLSLDVDAILDFALSAIADFDQERPVDAVVPCTHGSAIALLDASGNLVFPVMSYLAEIPEDVARAYDDIAPPFAEVLAPVSPGALTLGRQLLWLETSFPEDFQRVTTILPYAQYIAFRLCGVAASEVSSLGAQTHLWTPQQGTYSALARARGWSDLMAPMRSANDVLGPMTGLRLNGRGDIFCGIHDSNANYLQFETPGPLVLLSTGTWIIAFDNAADLSRLDPVRDQVANTTSNGTPVACARFMGGQEYQSIAGVTNAVQPSLDCVEDLISQGIFALPSFTDSGGPIPNTGGGGRFRGRKPQTALERASLAALYTGLMTSVALDQLGDTRRVIVDGVFATNAAFLGVLAAALPERDVFRSTTSGGSARGAALLALSDHHPEVEIEPIARPAIPGFLDYRAKWLSLATASTQYS